MEREANPILDMWEYLLNPALGNIVIERPEKFGGNLDFDSYKDLETAYLSGSLHPLDLKNGTASAFYDVVLPMQEACEADSGPYEILSSALN